MEQKPDTHRRGAIGRVPRVTSGVTCGVCSGLGGRSGLEYIEHRLRFVADDRANCPNCGTTFVWSRVTVAVRSWRIF